MTDVIRPDAGGGYPACMVSAMRPDFTNLLRAQALLEGRMKDLGGDPSEVIAVGADLLAFAGQEEPALFPLLPLLDPAARAELEREHVQLAEDLDLLASLVGTATDSADATELATALARRMRKHIERDGRLLAQVARLGQR